jgi:hypothetical protein
MDNMDMEECDGYAHYGNALVLVGFHIDFALCTLAVAHQYRRRK